ncbi:MAG TPA: DUF2723 domain-containing protein [Anaerolineae bacterium]|nr:DUF2723 domain-containing protein [Anaerolineae bacterium]HOQ99666.1 DUF2723 domain-containing protein [Anaerolineae bacterium]HPL26748.1 DUF2723 domain-containing protein [Anaerolineae bacterium]
MTKSSSWLRQHALAAAAALATGLYLSRLWCERFSQTSWGLLAAALAAGLALGALAVLLLQRSGRPAWPLALLAVYAVWPAADPRLALAAGTMAAVALLLAARAVHEPSLQAPSGTLRGFPGWLLDLLAGGGALALYIATLAPSVQPADAGEFQLVAAVLGIAHPPGYPLYTMLGKLFTLLPLGDLAWRVNLLAAVCAAATLAVVARTVRRATGSAAAGLLAALALGLTPTFWSQATLANVRSLTALFTALAIYWLLAYGAGRRPRDLVAFALTFGLGVTHHSSIGLLALPFAAYLLAVDPRLFIQPRRWLAPLAALILPLAVILYLPLRSAMNPSFDTPSVRTLGGLVSHVLALGFQGDFLYFLGQPAMMPLRWGLLADVLRIEFGWALAALTIILGLLAARRRWPWALLWGGVAAVNAFAAITYRAPQTVEYLLPAYVALAVGLGLGLGTLLARRTPALSPLAAAAAPSPSPSEGEGEGETPQQRPIGDASKPLSFPLAGGTVGGLLTPVGATIGVVLAALVACLALANGLAALPSYLALHRDNSARTQAVALLEAAPQGALILANWHQATPLWYLQQVEGLRRDVTVTYVYPEGDTPNDEVWARRIGEALGQRAVIVTNRYTEFSGLPCRFTPLGAAWRVADGNAPASLAEFAGTPQELDGRLLFQGARLAGQDAAPGAAVTVELAWRPQQPLDRDYSWFVHLEGPQGIAGQQDLTYQPAQVAAGETVVDTYRFTLRPNAVPGEYRLVAGAYITFADGTWQRLRTPDGRDTIELGAIHVHPRAEAPATAQPLRLAWADGSRLVGVDYDDSVAGQRRVYLHWYRPAGATDLDLTLSRGGQPAGQARAAGGAEAGYQSVACDVPPGGGLSLAVAQGGQPLAALGPWHLPLHRPLPLPNRGPGARYLDLGGEMALVGAHWPAAGPQPGAPFRAELQLLAARPLSHDYSISLSLEGEGWRAQHDGTPALGAIPTLKWLAGWQVRDPHLIDVPTNAGGPARLRFAVYDAFGLQGLAVGDDRLAMAGQGMQATLWEGELR